MLYQQAAKTTSSHQAMRLDNNDVAESKATLLVSSKAPSAPMGIDEGRAALAIRSSRRS